VPIAWLSTGFALALMSHSGGLMRGLLWGGMQGQPHFFNRKNRLPLAGLTVTLLMVPLSLTVPP
jgi:hypothetical protein